MTGEHVAFIGLDTSKLKISVAVADGERNGEVRFLGDISSEPASIAGMVKKLAKRGAKLHFCYEAGPTGYGLIDKSLNWVTNAVLSHRHWSQSVPVIG